MKSSLSLRFIWICLVFGVFRASSCNAITHVVLLQLPSANLNNSYYRESCIMFDEGEEDLRAKYGAVLNVTSVRLGDEDSTTCATAEQQAAFLASRYYYRDMQSDSAPVTGIFEAVGCVRSSKPLGDLAREWNIPLFTSSPDVSSFDEKRFLTVTTFAPFTSEDSHMLMDRLLEDLGYDKVAIIEDDMGRNYTVSLSRGFSAYIRTRFSLNSIIYQRIHRIRTISNSLGIEGFLQSIRSRIQVVFIIAEGDLVRSLMLTASDMQMTNGDYVFFALDLFPNTVTYGNLSWDTGNSDGRDMEARAAYRSLFTISVREEVSTPEYRNFIDDVKRLSAEKYHYTYAPNEEVDPFSIAKYYETVIFGQVLSEHIANGGDPHDGRSLSRSMWNRTFTVLGKNIVIDAKGNRASDWLLNQLDPDTGRFEPVVKYTSGDTAMKCVRDNLKIGDCLANMKLSPATTRPTPEEGSQWR